MLEAVIGPAVLELVAGIGIVAETVAVLEMV